MPLVGNNLGDESFNEARAVSPGRWRIFQDAMIDYRRASMRPGPFRPEMSPSSSTAMVLSTRFNEARAVSPGRCKKE